MWAPSEPPNYIYTKRRSFVVLMKGSLRLKNEKNMRYKSNTNTIDSNSSSTKRFLSHNLEDEENSLDLKDAMLHIGLGRRQHQKVGRCPLSEPYDLKLVSRGVESTSASGSSKGKETVYSTLFKDWSAKLRHKKKNKKNARKNEHEIEKNKDKVGVFGTRGSIRCGGQEAKPVSLLCQDHPELFLDFTCVGATGQAAVDRILFLSHEVKASKAEIRDSRLTWEDNFQLKNRPLPPQICEMPVVPLPMQELARKLTLFLISRRRSIVPVHVQAAEASARKKAPVVRIVTKNATHNAVQDILDANPLEMIAQSHVKQLVLQSVLGRELEKVCGSMLHHLLDHVQGNARVSREDVLAALSRALGKEHLSTKSTSRSDSIELDAKTLSSIRSRLARLR